MHPTNIREVATVVLLSACRCCGKSLGPIRCLRRNSVQKQSRYWAWFLYAFFNFTDFQPNLECFNLVPPICCFVNQLSIFASSFSITVTFKSFASIKLSCLHFGQYSGKFFSSVSSRICNLVLFPHTGHNIQFSFLLIPISCFLT